MTPEPIEAVIARLRLSISPDAACIDSGVQVEIGDLTRLLDYVEAFTWRPIESAPSNKAVLLAFSRDDTDTGETDPPVCVAYWDAYYAPGGYGYRGEGMSPWVALHSGNTIDALYGGEPTNWMPLPPPTAKGKK